MGKARPGHVRPEFLEEYRNLRSAANAVDSTMNWYYSRQRNPPNELVTSFNLIRARMDRCRSWFVPADKGQGDSNE